MLEYKTKIGKYFSLGEMIGNRPENIPSDKQLVNITQLCCKVLDPIREHFGTVNITSGYRNPYNNTRVGGAKNSQHLEGQAADFIIGNKNIHLREVYKWIVCNIEYDQLIFEKVGKTVWIHISYNILHNRKQNLIMIDNAWYNYHKDHIDHVDVWDD